MFESQIFLGVAITEPGREKMKKVKPSLRALLIQNKLSNSESHLSWVQMGQEVFLGKVLPQTTQIDSLDNAQKHIESIRFRLLGEEPNPRWVLCACPKLNQE